MPDDLTLPDGAVRIPLYARDGSVRAYAIVDAADAAWVNQWRWSLLGGRYVYRSGWVEGRARNLYLHRELLGLVRGDGLEGDHIDRDRLNHRRANLRVVRPSHNKQNVPSQKGTSSSYRGVTWDRQRGKWMANVMVNQRRVWVGRFETESEAAEAARQTRLRLMPYAVD